jgi:hypothetical protein
LELDFRPILEAFLHLSRAPNDIRRVFGSYVCFGSSLSRFLRDFLAHLVDLGLPKALPEGSKMNQKSSKKWCGDPPEHFRDSPGAFSRNLEQFCTILTVFATNSRHFQALATMKKT